MINLTFFPSVNIDASHLQIHQYKLLEDQQYRSVIYYPSFIDAQVHINIQ